MNDLTKEVQSWPHAHRVRYCEWCYAIKDEHPEATDRWATAKAETIRELGEPHETTQK